MQAQSSLPSKISKKHLARFFLTMPLPFIEFGEIYRRVQGVNPTHFPHSHPADARKGIFKVHSSLSELGTMVWEKELLLPQHHFPELKQLGGRFPHFLELLVLRILHMLLQKWANYSPLHRLLGLRKVAQEERSPLF